MLDELRPERILDNEIGVGESFLDVALAHLLRRDHVADPLDERRARLQRLHRIEHALERLELRLDQGHRLLGDVAGLGGDEGQRFAEIADALPHQDLLVGLLALLSGLTRDVGRCHPIGHVRCGEHAGDPGQRARLRHIQSAQRRAGEIAAQHLGVQRVRHRVIAGVAGGTQGLAPGVDALQRAADLTFLDVVLDWGNLDDRAHFPPPAAPAAATSLTASKIFL